MMRGARYPFSATKQYEKAPELIRVAFDDLKHLPWRGDVASDGVVLQVSRDEVRIHRGALAEDDFEEDDVDFVGKGFLGVLPRQEDGLFPKARDERFGLPSLPLQSHR